jgi:hypothetical protein
MLFSIDLRQCEGAEVHLTITTRKGACTLATIPRRAQPPSPLSARRIGVPAHINTRRLATGRSKFLPDGAQYPSFGCLRGRLCYSGCGRGLRRDSRTPGSARPRLDTLARRIRVGGRCARLARLRSKYPFSCARRACLTSPPGHACPAHHKPLHDVPPLAGQTHAGVCPGAGARRHRAWRARYDEADLECTAALHVHDRHALRQDREHGTSGRRRDHRLDPGQCFVLFLGCWV